MTVDTLRELKKGNLDVELPVITRDEIGIIGEEGGTTSRNRCATSTS